MELTARSWMGTAIMRKFGLNSTGFPADVSALFAMSAFFVLLFVHHSRICTYELAINSGNSFESGNDNKVLLLLLVLGLGLSLVQRTYLIIYVSIYQLMHSSCKNLLL